MKRMVRVVLPCVLLLASAIGLFSHGVPLHAARASSCSGTWSVIASPDPGSDSQLMAVAAISATDVWAVGYYYNNGPVYGLTAHWNGSSWTAVPAAAMAGTILLGVAAVATNDVWAVGNAPAGQSVAPFIEHWNGTSWSAFATPPAAGGDLYAAAAHSTSDVWAVGESGTGTTLIEHWNGTAWSIVPSYSVPGETNGLYGVTTLGAKTPRAVGTSYTSSLKSRSLIEHWTGTQWEKGASANVRGQAYDVLNGVAAVSATDIWAAGYSSNSYNQSQPLIEHWNGTQWSIVASPGGTALFGVSASSGTDAWAIGNSYNGGVSTTLTLHWNGTTWSLVTSPSPGAYDNELRGVAQVPGTTDAWAVGYLNNSAGGDTTNQSLTEFYC